MYQGSIRKSQDSPSSVGAADIIATGFNPWLGNENIFGFWPREGLDPIQPSAKNREAYLDIRHKTQDSRLGLCPIFTNRAL